MDGSDVDLSIAVRGAAQLRREGRLEDAERVLGYALEIAPTDISAQFELSLVLLAAGRFAEAWPLFERRFVVSNSPALPFRLWQGQVIDGKALLVVAEPALRAGLTFAESLPSLKARRISVTYICHPALVSEAERLGVDVIPMSGTVEFPDPDFWACEGSLPDLTGSKSEALSRWARAFSP